MISVLKANENIRDAITATLRTVTKISEVGFFFFSFPPSRQLKWDFLLVCIKCYH